MFYQLKSSEEQKKTTAGSALKGMRELRKMTQEQLACVTGIDLEIIQCAENDSETLSIENVKLLALFLRCHPASLIFNDWKFPPYQPEIISIDGIILINDKVESKKISIYISSQFGLKIRGVNSNKNLDINAFNSSMATALSFNNFRHPIKYHMEGSVLGRYYEHFNSGSESECNIRIVKKLLIIIKYDQNFVSFDITGLATIRDGQIRHSSSSYYTNGDWNFIVKFYIPINLISKCFGLYPDAEKNILALLAKV